LDPTVLLKSNGQVNPFRQIARVETISGSNVWSGVASDGVTAQFTAEATEATDGSPVLAQPTVNVEKAQAFVPFSIEIGEDWSGLTSELSRLFADAKDQLEAQKFTTGLGHGSNQPQGLLVGGDGDRKHLSGDHDLGRRRLRAVGRSPAAVPAERQLGRHEDDVRQGAAAGRAGEHRTGDLGGRAAVLRQLAYEASTYQSSTVVGNTAITVGDFSRFLIVDRVGLQVELVPHLFGTVNNYPTGQRGLYAYWRTSSAVLTPNAFRSLKV
jgi:predicted phage gp36 major capsid-like protein